MKAPATVWPFTANVLFFAANAAFFPFLVLYYQGLGFTGRQIGLLTGLTPLITLVAAPVWTSLADRTRQHWLCLSVVILGAAVALALLPTLTSFWPNLLIAVLISACLSPIAAFLDSATMFMLANRREMYGRVRLGGTFGFGVSAYLAGLLVQNYGLRLAFWVAAAGMLLLLAAGQKLAFRPVKAGEASGGSVRTLLANRRWLAFLVLAFAGGLAIAASNTYLFPYLKELGASESTMGLALTLGTISEVPVLFFGNRLIKRFKPYGLLMLGISLTGARLVLFFVSPDPTFVLFVQFLSGLTFPVMWLGGVAYADENAPPGLSATAQGLFGALVFGIGAAVGGFAGGPLLENLGGRGMFLVFGVSILAIAAGVALLARAGSGARGVPSSVDVV